MANPLQADFKLFVYDIYIYITYIHLHWQTVDNTLNTIQKPYKYHTNTIQTPNKHHTKQHTNTISTYPKPSRPSPKKPCHTWRGQVQVPPSLHGEVAPATRAAQPASGKGQADLGCLGFFGILCIFFWFYGISLGFYRILLGFDWDLPSGKGWHSYGK